MAISARQVMLREKSRVLGDMFSLMLRREALLLRLKFDRAEPRIPAGQPGGGQWAGEGETATGGGAEVHLVGGFDDDDLGKTVQQFMSEKCKGYIRGEMPRELLDSDLTIGEIRVLKKRGNAAAVTCIKLLNQDRFRK